MVKNNKLNLLAELFCYFTARYPNRLSLKPVTYIMIKRTVPYFPAIFALFFLGSLSANAQYYYKDIWSNDQLVKEFNILKRDRLKTIKLKSFDDDGEPSDGFFCEREINKSYTQSQMVSKSNITGQSLMVSDYNTAGQPVKTTDDTPTITNTTEFAYNDKGKVTLVRAMTKAEDDSLPITETHEYFYDQDGRPEKMLRKQNNVLMTTIHFVSDANGNTIEEDVVETSTSDRNYYYYYDEKNRLTDVVHYDGRAKRLLPSFMYAYQDLDAPEQMISTEDGGGNYLIWKYDYNDRGLRASEKCFSKDSRLLGSIQYEYQ